MADAGFEVLVCDDEPSLLEVLQESFTRDGHRVTAVANGPAALEQVSSRKFDVLLLDVALGPNSPNGFEVCRQIRGSGNGIPIIMLTALGSEADTVLGLEVGADDYVVKPFRPAELRSRIKALLRRASSSVATDEKQLHAGELVLDRATREVRISGELVPLTYSEFAVLQKLMSEPSAVHSRTELLQEIWGDDTSYRDLRAIDVHVRHLREKVESNPSEPQLILTVRRVGYRLGSPSPT